MAAGTVTVVQAEDWLKLFMNDSDTKILTAAEYLGLVDSHAEKTRQSYSCTLDGTGSKRWLYGNGPLFLTGISSTVPGFTIAADVDYTVCAGAVDHAYGSLSVSASGSGTDNTDPLVVTGRRVPNFRNCIVAMLEFIATNRALEYSQSQGSGSINPQTARQELLRMASVIQGVRAL